jgi:hypothetical protein
MQRDDQPVLVHLVQSAGVRLRINDALRALMRGLPAVLIVVCFALVVGKLSVLPVQAGAVLRGLVVLAGGAVLFGVGRAALRAAPWQRGALELDRHYALQDRLTSALEFQQRPPAERSALMEACIEQAALMARNLDVRKAVPLRVPREGAYSVLLLSLALLIHHYPVSTPTHRAVAQPAQEPAFVAEADDLALMRELANEWQHTTSSPQGREVAQRFNQLVMDIAAGKIDRHQVLERLQALQQSLSPLDAEQQAALNEGLEGLARALQSNPNTKRIAEALAEKNLGDAERALRELADKLKNKQAFDRKALEELRKTLQQASIQNTERSERLAAQRAEAEAEKERLLKKKQTGAPSNGSDIALAQKERQLERLQREQRKAQQTQQQMSELDRQLAEAARRLFEEMEQAGQSMQAGADDLARMGKQQLSEQEKEALKKQLEAMRQLVRQQGKAGDSQHERFRNFSQRARGQSPGAAPGTPDLRLGAGGVTIPGLPSPGSSGVGEKPGQGQSGSLPGDRAGSGTDPNLKGNANTLKVSTQDVTAAGIDTGQGPSASSVVFGAAERGFVGGDYKRIYTEYKTVAEETLQQDQVPAGYEGHVRRYFQLIRPRD